MVRLLEKKQRSINSLTIFAIAAFGLHFFVLLFLVIQGIKIRQLSQRQPSNFVQLIDGKKVTVKDDLDRDPAAIKQFVTKTMILMFNWSGKLSSDTISDRAVALRDRGILISTPQAGNNKVTTSSWIASFALSEDFRRGFLREIATITPPEVFIDDDQQGLSGELIIKRIDLPKKIVPGKWRVGLVANLIQKKRGDGTKIITPFNKDLLVRATDYFSYPLPDNITDLQGAIYAIRSSKMEIYEIRDLCLIENYNNNSHQERLNSCTNSQDTDSFIK
jgi:hypothetical protein